MSMQWGVYEQRDQDGTFIAFHVMPVVVIEGEEIRSGDHILSSKCSCNPLVEISEETGCAVHLHHDPDYPGALPEEEWHQKKSRTTT
jgi:hypothetical protein